MPRRSPHTALFATLACAALLSLTGCGGGSDSGSTDLSETAKPGGGGGGNGGGKITAKNAPLLARDSLDLATSLHDLAGLNYGVLTGASVDTARRIPDVLSFAYRHLSAFAGSPIPGGQALGGIVVTETFPCRGGGSFTVAFDDADSNGRLSTADGATFTFSSCASDGLVASGRIGYSRLDVSGPSGTPSGLAADFTYSRFRVLDAGIETSVEGSARYGVVVTTVAPAPLAIEARTVISSMTYSSSDGWRYTLSDLSSEARTDYGSSAYVLSMRGTISNRTFGAMAVTTSPPFEGTVGQPPMKGSMTVRASDNSQVRLTSLAASGARVEVDSNADRAYESNTTFTWAALNAL